MDYAAWRRVLADEALPAAIVDLDAFDRNITRFARMLADAGARHRLRLATKSVRVPALIQRILDFGPPYQGLMCYTVPEAIFLSQRGFRDLLVAYPTRQARDFHSLRAAHEAGESIKLMVDSLEGCRAVAEVMRGTNAPFPLVLDVDMSLRLLSGRVHLGVRRSPVRDADAVVALFDQANELEGVRLVGLMGYEAQVAGLGDRNPFQRMMRPIHGLVRRRSIQAVAALRAEIAERLTQRGHAIELFNGGGTGSVPHTAKEPWLTELTVGSGFLCAHLFSYYSDVPIEPACFFALRVVRSSDPGYVTCQGGGYIASGAPGWEKVPVPYLPEDLRLTPVEGCGEVQTPLLVPPGVALGMGAPVLFRHAKAGELAEHFNEYLLVADGRITERAPTYRGLGQCFLG